MSHSLDDGRSKMAWARLGRRVAAAVAGGALLFGAGCGFGGDGSTDRTRVTLTATPPAGNDTTAATAPTNAALERSGEILTARFEAAALTGPVDPDTEPDLMAVLAPFAQLAPEEVAALPVELQFELPQIGCATLADRPAGVGPDRLPTVACDGELKYRLDEAKVTGGDIASAVAELGTVGAEWYVQLTFTEAGQARWTALSEEAVRNPDGACQAAGASGNCQVAIVLDGTVISAPQIIGVIRGPAQITGSYSEDEARLLAARLGHGELPLVLEVDSFGAAPAD